MWYNLKGKTPVPCSVEEIDRSNNQLGDDTVKILDDYSRVSTVFLALDHGSFISGPPILFETMVFGGRLNEFQYRYSNYDSAMLGHETILKYINGFIFEDEFNQIMSKIS